MLMMQAEVPDALGLFYLAMSKLSNRLNRAAIACQLAEKEWGAGNLKRAFQLFLAAAKGGYVPAFGMVAAFYDQGWGVRPNAKSALYWHQLSYRSTLQWHRLGLAITATNIGCIWRDRNKPNLALKWFKRAIELGDGDANLNVAEIYLHDETKKAAALRYLRNTISAKYVTQGSIEEAHRLMRQLKGKSARRPVAKAK
jgi:TPR repeat protein